MALSIPAAGLALLMGTAAANAADFHWQLPRGFLPPPVPADNPMSVEKIELGRRLFFDTRLSSTGEYSCASCHRPDLAYTDGRARAVGATGDRLRRSAPTLINVAYAPRLTWSDPRVRSLEAQMRLPLFNRHPVELGYGIDEPRRISAIRADREYATLFVQAFGESAKVVSTDHIIKAIAAFERTLIAAGSPFDRYIFEDDRAALSPAAKRGMTAFYSPDVGCAACHYGINFSGTQVTEAQPRPAKGTRGRLRVPTLRNVELTAPYMHDGRIPTLDAALAHDTSRHVALTLEQRHDLLAFLRSLTDPTFAPSGRIATSP